MSPVTSIVLCAVFFFAVSFCDSFSKADETELKRDPKIVGIEGIRRVWGEKGNFEDVNVFDGVKTNPYGMERDGTKRMEAVERRWYRPKCGGRPYSPAFNLCCNGHIVSKKGSSSACCGRYSYSTSFNLCCSGHIVSKKGWSSACCGRYSYSTSFNLCCSGHIVSKKGWSSACCGRYSYSTSFNLCCSGHIVSKKGWSSACCGRYSYSTSFYLCCSGRLKRKSGWNPSC